MVSLRRNRSQEPAPDDGTTYVEQPVHDRHEAYDRFGGANIGAAFFGWMVAVGMTVLLTAVLGAVLAVLGETATLDDLEGASDLTTVGLVTALVLLGVLLVAYYSGGYVAGRMSRFDGARQGLVVWVLALLFSVLAALAGYVAGEQYDVVDRADLPTFSVSTEDLTTAGVVSVVVVLVGTLLAAMAGGKVGQRYHTKVDRVS